MTPQERQLVDELFDRLATLENSPRDPDAERAIIDGLRRAPNAVYALVQTALVQDEALKRAHARIEELEGGGQPNEQQQPRGFLDNVRDTLFGREEPRRGSVPNARTGGLGSSGAWGAGPSGPPPGPSGYGQPPGYGQPKGYGQPPQGYGYGPGPSPVGSGGSFLGTAAASAAGVIGGAMLLNSVRSMFGHSGSGSGSSAFDSGSSAGSPWGGGNAANSELARQAGIDDVGSSRSASRSDDSASRSDNSDSSRSGVFGGSNDQDPTDTAYDDDSDDTDPTADFDDDDSDNA
jgi:uncharacterized protein